MPRFRTLVPAVLFALQTAASIPAHAASPCALSPVNPSVTVCTPAVNGLVQSPVNVVAGSTDSHTVTKMQIYVDNKLVTSTNGSTINSFVTLPVGNHLITVQGWDNTGATFKSNVPVAMQPPCNLSSTNRTVTICSMVNGSVVSQPFHVVAAATDSTPVTGMSLVIDGATKSTVSNSAMLDFYVSSLGLGSHTIAVQAKDSSGGFSQSIKITVTGATQGLSHIKHIIFMVQENRSFDDYFGRLGAYRASLGLPNNIDGMNLSTTLHDVNGRPVNPYHYQTECTDNLTPSWDEGHLDVDGGKMDQFVITNGEFHSSSDPTGTRAMGYYNQSDLTYYYSAAAQFATSDRFFSPVLSNTIPNRMYLFTGTSFGNAFPVSPPSGGFTQPTIFAHLDKAGVSWRYYYQGAESSAFIEQFSIFQTDFKKVVPLSNWSRDIQNPATLPSVIFIERGGTIGTDEHPDNNVQTGASLVASIVNPLMHSPSWADSVFILFYDESGGFYDHVPPAREVPPDKIAPKLKSTDQKGQFNQSGLRVPLIVFSPWVKPKFVSHTTRDYTSVLRLIEDTFNVRPFLTLRDQFADNMMEFFDFSGGPQLLTPPPLMTQPTNGACKHSLEAAPGF